MYIYIIVQFSISQMTIDGKERLRPVHTKNIKYNQKCGIYLTEFSSNTLGWKFLENLMLWPKPLPIHYIGCQPFSSAVRILSERLHCLLFTHNAFWFRVYNRCTLAEALFPTIQCGEPTSWKREQVWMRDAVYIFLISALTFISYII